MSEPTRDGMGSQQARLGGADAVVSTALIVLLFLATLGGMFIVLAVFAAATSSNGPQAVPVCAADLIIFGSFLMIAVAILVAGSVVTVRRREHQLVAWPAAAIAIGCIALTSGVAVALTQVSALSICPA
ncbi:hypothetical protein ACX9R5_03245 [Rathayibacter sp. CAU 1779]